MSQFLVSALGWAAIMGAATLLLWALSGPLLSRYRPGTLAACWLLLALAWMMPFRPSLFSGPEGSPRAAMTIDPYGFPQTASTSWILLMLSVVWGAGTIVLLIVKRSRHRRLLRHVRRFGRPLDEAYLSEARCQASELGVKRMPELLAVPGIGSPMVVGVRRTLLLVPSNLPQPSVLVLRHELAHVRRRDLVTRAALDIFVAMQWWNPFMHLVARNARLASEVACDEIALRRTSSEERFTYARSLLCAAAPDVRAANVAAFSGRRLYGVRLRAVLDRSAKRHGVLLGGVLALGLAVVGVPVALHSDGTDLISTEVQTPTTAPAGTTSQNGVDAPDPASAPSALDGADVSSPSEHSGAGNQHRHRGQAHSSDTHE